MKDTQKAQTARKVYEDVKSEYKHIKLSYTGLALTAMDRWGNIEYLRGVQTQSDLVSKEKIIEILQNRALVCEECEFHEQAVAIRECITKIESV